MGVGYDVETERAIGRTFVGKGKAEERLRSTYSFCGEDAGNAGEVVGDADIRPIA
jgi:hypothetical protein